MIPLQTVVSPRTSVVGGIRVSTDQQADAYGPDRQRQEIQREADRAGFEVVHWVEESVSGANHKRAVENEYYAWARCHPGINFVFSHPNRVGRHVEVIVGIARTIHDLGGTVWVAGLGNLREPRNWKNFLRDAADAESDYQNIVHQLVSGKRTKASEGKWPHGAVPWGYVLQRDTRGRSTVPVPDPEVAPIIRRLFDLAETVGGTKTQTLLNSEGLPAPKGGRWTRSSIKQYLCNERYTGVAAFQGVTLTFEPIVSKEQFDRVQAVRATRKKESGPRDRTLLWSGRARCAVCGGAVGRNTHKTPHGQYVYYRCWRARQSHAQRDAGQEPCANGRNHPMVEAERRWWDYFVERITSPDLLAEIVAPPAVLETSPPPARVAELETAIARAWEPFVAGKITQVMAERLAEPHVRELERLQQGSLPKAPPPVPAYDDLAARFASAVAGAVATEDRQALLRLLDVRLYIGPDGPERMTVCMP